MSTTSECESSTLIHFAVNQGNGGQGPIQIRPKNHSSEVHSIPRRQATPEPNTIWGFFQIINHGIPLEVLENVKDADHKFFELPNEERKKYLMENSPSPTVQLKNSFSPLAEKVLEWKDYLLHFYVPDDEASELWPSVSK
ncbi:hypothetical protein ACH5RR_021370 [Cinchona calisaya]|uniref:Non-haem dioxygenase N-terminal domain-containing protein n=1 Tax=Cinchona calisaya TaxID=153742 RepID=A0ABD2ZH39_9GENT